jgi:hypothetical protein
VQWTQLKWRNGPRAFQYNRSAPCDAEGRFELWGAGRGTYAISTVTSDGLVAVGVFDNPPANPVELRVRPAVDVAWRRPADPTQVFTVTVFAAGQSPVAAWRLEPSRLRFVGKLPPGEYSYEVHDDGDRLVRSGRLQLSGGTVTVQL